MSDIDALLDEMFGPDSDEAGDMLADQEPLEELRGLVARVEETANKALGQRIARIIQAQQSSMEDALTRLAYHQSEQARVFEAGLAEVARQAAIAVQAAQSADTSSAQRVADLVGAVEQLRAEVARPRVRVPVRDEAGDIVAVREMFE